MPVEAGVFDSVQDLRVIRTELQDRVRRRWWQSGEVDKRRWRYLYNLIGDRITEAQANLACQLVGKLRAVSADGDGSVSDQYEAIERCVFECFEKGELTVAQESMLLALLERCRREKGDDEPFAAAI